MRARRRFLLPHKKYMIENGFEGIGLVLVAVPICLGLACILLVGVGAAVFLALARRSPFSDDDDAGNDRQDYQHAAAAKRRRRRRCFRRQAAFDQPRRGRRLDDDVLAGAAGIFGPTYDQHPELRRHDVELLADVLANPVKLGGTLGRRRTRN
jgi:hypothetical protein